MKRILCWILLGTALAFNALAGKHLVNVDKFGVAIQGYDPVAYFTFSSPVKGRAEFSSTHDGATYWFSARRHKEMFDREPAKYVPQFGGFCAYGVSRNAVVPIDPEAWQIVDGRLLLQKNKSIRDDFNADAAGNLRKADANWPQLVEKKGK